MTKILFFLKRAFQAAYFEVSMVKIGSQTIGGIYQSLSPIKTAESESHATLSKYGFVYIFFVTEPN